ncbi:hypothetical protein HPP92_017221 [Vanilla planifolia]|uniref:UspA domain-containing protein n=1 Tax=Vanilla planifolia TaxID=51239 RepID=A0A835QGM7_VANPL|nr:hypothetical protein HPP92_017221 [Vanilla planifolia]
MAELEVVVTFGDEQRESMVFLVAIDNSEENFYALRWVLRHYFSGAANPGAVHKLVVVYAKPIPSAVIGIGGLGAVDVLPYVESDLSKIADGVIQKARDLCVANSVDDATFDVSQGEAKTVLCGAAEKYQADMLVMGCRGYGAVRRAVLGSVKDYCTRYAQCNVLIVKKPLNTYSSA